jgi:hypothetical protein
MAEGHIGYRLSPIGNCDLRHGPPPAVGRRLSGVAVEEQICAACGARLPRASPEASVGAIRVIPMTAVSTRLLLTFPASLVDP